MKTPKYGLSRSERVRGRKLIDRLFAEGSSGFIFPLRYCFLVEYDTAEGAEEAPAKICADAAEVFYAEGNETVSAEGCAENSAEGCAENAAENSTPVESAPDANLNKGVSMMVSVPKRYFKRAVKRNLLKRRVREAFRLNKHIIAETLIAEAQNGRHIIACGQHDRLTIGAEQQDSHTIVGARHNVCRIHIAFIYCCNEVAEFRKINSTMKRILNDINKKIAAQPTPQNLTEAAKQNPAGAAKQASAAQQGMASAALHRSNS